MQSKFGMDKIQGSYKGGVVICIIQDIFPPYQDIFSIFKLRQSNIYINIIKECIPYSGTEIGKVFNHNKDS